MHHASIALLVLALASCSKEPAKPPPTKEVAPEPQPKTVTPPAGDPAKPDLAGTYEIDGGHSAVIFKIKHLDVSHTLGRFNKVSGSLVIDADPTKSKVEIDLDPASVFTADKKRDDHLRSPDFLNVAQFPTIKFASTAVKAAGDGYEVTGELELHGTKKPVTAKFELVGSGKHPMDPKQFLVGFTGTLDIKRSDFGMTNMVGPVGDDIHLIIAIEAARK